MYESEKIEELEAEIEDLQGKKDYIKESIADLEIQHKKQRKQLEEEYEKIIKNYKTNFTKAMKESGIGSISEVYDSKPPYNPGGCFTQGWSVSETIKIMLED